MARPPGACAIAVAALTGAAVPVAAAQAIPLAGADLAAYDATYAISGAVTGRETWQVPAGARGTTDVTLETAAGPARETNRLVLAARGLALRSVHETLRAPGLVATITARASGGRLSETAVVNGRVEHAEFPIAPTTYANVALLPTLAGLALRPGERAVVHDVVLKHAGVVPIGLAVADGGRVRTPAGTFRCLAVTLAWSAGSQTAWVSTGPEPVLVRYRNPQTTFTLTSLQR